MFFAIIFLLLGGLAGAGYYLTTDSGARKFILPLVSKKLGVEITAEHIHWKPFSSLKIDGLRIGPEKEPLLKSKQLIAQYDGWRMLRGNYEIQHLSLDSPVVRLGQKSDGSPEGAPRIMQSVLASSQIFTLSLLDAENVHLSYAGHGLSATLHPLRLHAKNIKSLSTIPLEFQTDIAITESTATASAEKTTPLLAGRLKSSLNVQVDDHLMPKSIQGDVSLDDLHVAFPGMPLEGLSVPMKFEITLAPDGTTVLKEAQAAIHKGGKFLTTLNATGVLNLPKNKAELDIQCFLQGNVLNRMLATKKLDFQDSSLNYSAHLSISDNGDRITAKGSVESRSLNVTHPAMPRDLWKSVALTADHLIELSGSEKRVLISALNFNATRQGRPFLKGTLNKPISFTWAKTGSNPTDALIETPSLALQIFSFDVTPFSSSWKLPSNWKISSGMIDANAKILVEDGGRNLTLDGQANITRLGFDATPLKLSNASVQFDGKVRLKNFRSAQFQSSSLRVTENNKPILTSTIDGKIEIPSRTGSGVLQFDTSLPNLSALKPSSNFIQPQAGLTVSSGAMGGILDWELHAGNRVTCKSDIMVRNLDFGLGEIQYQKTSFALNANVEWTPSTLKLDKIRLTTLMDGQPAGSGQGRLWLDSQNQHTFLKYNLQGWKESMLAPLLSAWAPGNKLTSLELNGEGELTVDGWSLGCKTTMEARQLHINDGLLHMLSPLNVTISTDLAYAADGNLTLNSMSLQFEPTSNAKNLVKITGKAKHSPDLLFATLHAHSESLDLSHCCDQVLSYLKNTSPETPETSTANLASQKTGRTIRRSPQISPRGHDITILTSIDSLRIHDLVFSNVSIPLERKGTSLKLNNISLQLGDAPISATLALENKKSQKPFHFEARGDGLPFGPLIDTIRPDWKGLTDGVLTAHAYGSGNAFSPSTLKKSLNAHLDADFHGTGLEKLPPFQHGLQQLGNGLDSAAICNSSLAELKASGKLASGKFHADHVHLAGPDMVLSLQGDIFPDRHLQMETGLKLERRIMEQSVLLSRAVDLVSPEEGGWMKFPGTAEIIGTINEPIIQVDPVKLLRAATLSTDSDLLEAVAEKGEHDETRPPHSYLREQQPPLIEAPVPVEVQTMESEQPPEEAVAIPSDKPAEEPVEQPAEKAEDTPTREPIKEPVDRKPEGLLDRLFLK